MATKTLSPTENEQRLGNMFSEITSLARTADDVLLLPDDQTSQTEAARILLKIIGSIADMGVKHSKSGHTPMMGGVEAWLGLDKFALDAKETRHE